MATAMSAPALDDALNFTSGLDSPRHNNITHNMAQDDQYTVERPRAVASTERNGNSSSPSSNSNNNNKENGNTDAIPPPARRVSRLGMAKNKGKLAVTTPSQEDLHTRWAEMQDPSSVINSNSFRSEQEQQRHPLNIEEEQEEEEEREIVPAYVQPAPRPLYFDTVIRDFAYPSHHLLHNGSSYDHGPEEDDFPSDDQDILSNWGSSNDQPGPYRRLSDSAESSTFNTGIGGGGPHWTHGIWGGDGGIYEDMEPLPSTSFRENDEMSLNPQSIKKQHRKSRSFADASSYERGRRRGESNASKRGSHHGGEGGHSDPAGRDALRASRGMEPTEGLDDDMYALSLSQQQSGSDRHRARRDSHVATLPSRAFHEGQRPEDPQRTISDLPLDLEDVQHSSPQRESLGPEDEELFAGPSLALYDFEPENDNELRIREREIIMVSYRHGLGWLVAENEKGERGLVPEEYVRLLSDMEEWEGVEEA